MGRAPCCDKASVKKGPWSPEEDLKLKDFIEKNGTGGNWIALPHKAGLKRCGKSCRLRWLNYLRPNIKHGEFTDDEDRIICNLFATIGSRWSIIAAQLPGRTDNDIKNYWNTKLKKKLMGLIPSSHHHHLKKPPTQQPLQYFSSSSSSPHLQTSSSISFNGTSTYNPTRSSLFSSSTTFMGFLSEHMSKLSSNHHLLNNTTTTNTTLLQTQENSLGPIQNHQVLKDNSFMFGAGDQPSCSSSDGSCNHNIHEYEHYGGNGGGVGTYKNGTSHEQMVLEVNHNFYDEAVVAVEENHQKFVVSSSNGGDHHGWSTTTDHQKQNGFWGNHHQYGQNVHNHHQQYYSSAHGYGSVDVEEIKQVIVTGSSNHNNLLFSSDENKTQGGGGGGGEGKEVMYYY